MPLRSTTLAVSLALHHTCWVVRDQASCVGTWLQLAGSVGAILHCGCKAELASCQEGGCGGNHDLQEEEKCSRQS